jgi:hypothetical protein
MTWTETIRSFASPELFSLVFLIIAAVCFVYILDSKRGIR